MCVQVRDLDEGSGGVAVATPSTRKGEIACMGAQMRRRSSVLVRIAG
jgi:hypothetical protein